MGLIYKISYGTVRFKGEPSSTFSRFQDYVGSSNTEPVTLTHFHSEPINSPPQLEIFLVFKIRTKKRIFKRRK